MIQKVHLGFHGLRAINIHNKAPDIGAKDVEGGREGVMRGGDFIQGDEKRVSTNGSSSKGTLRIYRNGDTLFPYSRHHLRDDLTGTFGFLQKKDRRLIFLNLDFEHCLFRETVDSLDIQGEDIHWLIAG